MRAIVRLEKLMDALRFTQISIPPKFRSEEIENIIEKIYAAAGEEYQYSSCLTTEWVILKVFYSIYFAKLIQFT